MTSLSAPFDGGDAVVTGVEYRGAVWSCAIELSGGSRVRALHAVDEPPDIGARVCVALRDGRRLLRCRGSGDDGNRVMSLAGPSRARW